MNLNGKHIKAILKVSHLRKELLEDPISEEDCIKYDFLNAEKKEMITAQVMYVMNRGSASHLGTYSNPVSQYIDPIEIYGEKGIYLVCEVDYQNFTFFTNKKEAFKYANQAYDAWYEVSGFEEDD